MENVNMNFIGCDSSLEDAKFVLFGAPFDSTTSYRPGARFGPMAMRVESFGIETFSLYKERDLLDICAYDSGDIELPFGDSKRALEMIEKRSAEILSLGKVPVMLGGEHLTSLGSVRAVAKKYDDLHIVHFDAHADLRENYLGVKLSHACVLRRIHEIVGDDKIYQFGIRSCDKDEFMFSKSHTKMQKFNFTGLDDVIKILADKPVYFTIDLDVLDSSEFPGTGTPEAGGVTFASLVEAMEKVATLNIVGCDLVELSPHYDNSGISTALACKTLRELLLSLSK